MRSSHCEQTKMYLSWNLPVVSKVSLSNVLDNYPGFILYSFLLVLHFPSCVDSHAVCKFNFSINTLYFFHFFVVDCQMKFMRVVYWLASASPLTEEHEFKELDLG